MRTRRSNALADAQDGNLDSLSSLADEHLDDAYKWLLVAADYGHEDAWGHISDLEEFYDELRYDDDGHRTMWIRFHLCRAYFLAEDGLPADDAKALGHLQAFVDAAADVAMPKADYFDDLISGTSDSVRQIIASWFRANPFRAVKRRVDRLLHLYDIGSVPLVVMQGEMEHLRAEVDALAGLITPDTD